MDNYDDARHSDLWDLIKNPLALKIVYDSVYGGDAHGLAYRIETLPDRTSGL